MISGQAFPGEKSDFRGYDRYDRIKTAKGHFSVVCPKNPAPGKPWLWRSLFWEAVKPFSDTDLKLVDEGKTMVMVRHSRTLAARASRIIEIRDGRIASDHPSALDRHRAIAQSNSNGIVLPTPDKQPELAAAG